MKKAQVIKFWKALENSTNSQQVISALANKEGYDSKRTLGRYKRAYDGFKQNLSLDAISKKTGWKTEFIGTIMQWFGDEFHPETPATEESTINCEASPDNIDVGMLKSWGISPKKAPDLLGVWRSFHRKGEHDICKLYLTLKEDIQVRKIPFPQAESLLETAIKAQRFHLQEIQRDVELARIYRAWEGEENRSAYLRESNELRKPGPLKLKHLHEITQILGLFQLEIDEAIEKHQWVIKFSIEEDELFNRMLDHCTDIKESFNQFTQKKGHDTIKNLQRSVVKCLENRVYLDTVCSICIDLGNK